jgi:hypothetical protein
MRKDSRFILAFAVFGLAIAGGIAAYMTFSGLFDEVIFTAFVILCPPALLITPFHEAMKAKGGSYLIWSMIGLLNAGIYAAIGAAIIGLRSGSRTRPD